MYYCDLSDELWTLIQGILPKEGSLKGGRPPGDVRTFINAIHWIVRTGAPWRALPERFGSWKTVYSRFRRWQQKGFWEGIMNLLTPSADMEYVMIDGSYIHAHKHSTGAKRSLGDQAIGRSRGGLTTKLHAVTDALGYLIRFVITGGQCADVTMAPLLLEPYSRCGVLADKGYDSDILLEQIQRQNCTATIPGKRNRVKHHEIDRHLYKERHLIENFFCKIKEFRRIATRYDKLMPVFHSFICFASVLIWLR